tara:strand:- start:5310 stop:6149 length:840 start_codon:yes stop_codon:yes gene_type:complete
MATKLNTATWMNRFESMVVFDLEFVGDITNPSQCHLWEIGAVHVNSNDRFHVVVDPGIPTIPPPENGCFPLTQSFLNTNAIALKIGLQMFVKWASKYRLFVAHNCFKSDMYVLAGAFARCGMQCPSWMFVDSLLILRRNMPSLQNYKLSTVFDYCMNKQMTESHRALPDAEALKSIMLTLGPPRDIVFAYPFMLTPLQNIRGIGHSCEVDLVRKGFRSVESLVEKIICEKAAMNLWQDVSMEDAVGKFLQCLQLPLQNMETVHEYIVWRINRDYIDQNE